MNTLDKNGRVVSAVDDYRADVFIDGETVTTIGKRRLYDNVLRTGMMLNTTTNAADRLVEALDAGLALC